jgi:simple sugar transport system ATP-binding protein
MAELSHAPAAKAQPAPGHTHAVRLEGVSMAFGKVVALRNIDFAVGRNEIVGLIGDNGAGKSTLIKILTGVLKPTGGKLYIRDQHVAWEAYSVRRAHEFRIETVHQEKSLGEKQPLWRNFFAGRQITNRLGFINVRREREIANQILLQTLGFRGVGIDADSTVSKLSGGERQGIAIGRAMHFDADLIVLDEPTTALAVKEVRKVFAFIERIKASGHACIYIEHNLAHVLELADRLVVMDRGEIVSVVPRGAMNLYDLTNHLLELQSAKPSAARGGHA